MSFFNIKALGRAAHPGDWNTRTKQTPTGFYMSDCGTPSGFVLGTSHKPRVRCATLGYVIKRRWRLNYGGSFLHAQLTIKMSFSRDTHSTVIQIRFRQTTR